MYQKLQYILRVGLLCLVLDETAKYVEKTQMTVEKLGVVKWLKKEFKPNKEMLPYKLVLFLYYGGMFTFLPYLTLHMQEIGINVEEIALTYAALPVAAVLGRTSVGLIADKTGSYTAVVIVNIALTAILHTALLAVPYNPSHKMLLETNNSSYNLSWVDCANKEFLEENLANSQLVTIKFSNCEIECNKTRLCFSNEFNNSCDNKTAMQLELDSQFSINGTLKKTVSPFTCGSFQWENFFINNETYKNIESDCATKCYGQVVLDKQIPSTPVTFYTYFVLRNINTMTMSASFTMLDALVLAKLKTVSTHYGRQRVTTMYAAAIFPLTAGILVDYFNTGEGATDYSAMFYAGDVMLFISIVILAFLNLKLESTEKNLFRNFLALLSRFEVDVFLFIILILGTNWGFDTTYLFPYLKTLNAPTYLMGLLYTVTNLIGLPLVYFSDLIMKKIGRSKIFFSCFIAYSVKFLSYSFITSPWHAIPIGLIEIITYQLLWVVAATYAPVLAPAHLLATMTALNGATHFTMGRGLGGLIGGFLISHVGLINTYRCFAGAALASSMIYFAAYKLVLEKKMTQINIIKNEVVKDEIITNEVTKNEVIKREEKENEAMKKNP